MVNDEFSEKYLKGRSDKLFLNTLRRNGPGSSTASLQINLLPGENRPDVIRTNMVSSRIRELVGPVNGAESVVYGAGDSFGGPPVSVSLLGNNIEELKAAKLILKNAMNENSALKDVEDNDPEDQRNSIDLKRRCLFVGIRSEYCYGTGAFGILRITSTALSKRSR